MIDNKRGLSLGKSMFAIGATLASGVFSLSGILPQEAPIHLPSLSDG